MGTNLVMMGPPGAGKGTQAVIASREAALAHLSTGDLLRREVAAGSPVGLKAKGCMDAGTLVPDAVMTELIGEHLVREGARAGFILDGFPRTVDQAKAMSGMLERNRVALTGVINISVADSEILARLSRRLTCPKDQRTYHATDNPPKKAGVCDECGTALAVRPDDNEKTVRQRLEVYRAQTVPALEYYRNRDLVRDVDGTRPIDAIAQAIRSIIREIAGGGPRATRAGATG
jgi:adenylate kinase